MERQENRQLTEVLASHIEPDVDGARIADVIVSAWQTVDSALTPIIGRGGVVALYGRGLYLTGLAHPWLATEHEPVPTDVDLVSLKSVLANQSRDNAITGGLALMQTFHGLLTNLIGASLTEQLVGSVWAKSLSDLNAQETSP